MGERKQWTQRRLQYFPVGPCFWTSGTSKSQLLLILIRILSIHSTTLCPHGCLGRSTLCLRSGPSPCSCPLPVFAFYSLCFGYIMTALHISASTFTATYTAQPKTSHMTVVISFYCSGVFTWCSAVWKVKLYHGSFPRGNTPSLHIVWILHTAYYIFIVVVVYVFKRKQKKKQKKKKTAQFFQQKHIGVRSVCSCETCLTKRFLKMYHHVSQVSKFKHLSVHNFTNYDINS